MQSCILTALYDLGIFAKFTAGDIDHSCGSAGKITRRETAF